MLWIIYYDDGTTFSDEDGTWYAASPYGIQIIMDYMPETPLVHMGHDYYLMRNDTIMSFGDSSLRQHIIAGIESNAMKFGLWTDNDNWNRIHERVFGVPGVPTTNPRG